MVQTIWNYNLSQSVINALKKLSKNEDGFVTMAEFTLLCRYHSEILQPLRSIKEKLQKVTVHKRFWKQIIAHRLKVFQYKLVFEILARNHTDSDYVMSSLDYLVLRPEVPTEYKEQWNYLMKKKAHKRKGNVDIPYEVDGNLARFSVKNSQVVPIKIRPSMKYLLESSVKQ